MQVLAHREGTWHARFFFGNMQQCNFGAKVWQNFLVAKLCTTDLDAFSHAFFAPNEYPPSKWRFKLQIARKRKPNHFSYFESTQLIYTKTVFFYNGSFCMRSYY
jgi:hypothetical protein